MNNIGKYNFDFLWGILDQTIDQGGFSNLVQIANEIDETQISPAYRTNHLIKGLSIIISNRFYASENPSIKIKDIFKGGLIQEDDIDEQKFLKCAYESISYLTAEYYGHWLKTDDNYFKYITDKADDYISYHLFTPDIVEENNFLDIIRKISGWQAKIKNSPQQADSTKWEEKRECVDALLNFARYQFGAVISFLANFSKSTYDLDNIKFILNNYTIDSEIFSSLIDDFSSFEQEDSIVKIYNTTVPFSTQEKIIVDKTTECVERFRICLNRKLNETTPLGFPSDVSSPSILSFLTENLLPEMLRSDIYLGFHSIFVRSSIKRLILDKEYFEDITKRASDCLNEYYQYGQIRNQKGTQIQIDQRALNAIRDINFWKHKVFIDSEKPEHLMSMPTSFYCCLMHALMVLENYSSSCKEVKYALMIEDGQKTTYKDRTTNFNLFSTTGTLPTYRDLLEKLIKDNDLITDDLISCEFLHDDEEVDLNARVSPDSNLTEFKLKLKHKILSPVCTNDNSPTPNYDRLQEVGFFLQVAKKLSILSTTI